MLVAKLGAWYLSTHFISLPNTHTRPQEQRAQPQDWWNPHFLYPFPLSFPLSPLGAIVPPSHYNHHPSSNVTFPSKRQKLITFCWSNAVISPSCLTNKVTWTYVCGLHCMWTQTSCAERVQGFLLGASLRDQRKDIDLCRTTTNSSEPCNSQQWRLHSSPTARTICCVLYVVFTQELMLPVSAATGQVLCSCASAIQTQIETWKDNYHKMTGEMLWGARMPWAERCMLVHPQGSNRFCIQ